MIIKDSTLNLGEVKIAHRSKERNGHPTQKPLQLMERCVTIWSNEDDTIFDFTMGSGTTAVASLKLKRNFIGIEKDSHYFKIAEDRLNSIKKENLG